MHYNLPTPHPDIRLAGSCGLFCPSCKIYIATRDRADIRKRIAESLYLPTLNLECEGCRSDSRYYYCQTCEIKRCAASRNLDFCGECLDYPCVKLSRFQAQRPHRSEVFANQDRILEAGFETWFQEMIVRYSCPECGTLNSAYHLTCPTCRTSPSCAYVSDHKAEIIYYLSTAAIAET
ncbi:MAG: DUF3795 domain-containing protein [Anaerolineales bacterium]|jgi:hypothetical protein